jgi:prefoldin beta subunit
MEEDTQKKIQQLQTYEQTLQQLLMQKQAFQLELNETESALAEILKTEEDIYKMVGQIMIKAEKKDVEKELKQKKDLLSLRLESLEKQESTFTKQVEELRDSVMKEMK